MRSIEPNATIVEDGDKIVDSIGPNATVTVRNGNLTVERNIGPNATVKVKGNLTVKGNIGPNVTLKVQGEQFLQPTSRPATSSRETPTPTPPKTHSGTRSTATSSIKYNGLTVESNGLQANLNIVNNHGSVNLTGENGSFIITGSSKNTVRVLLNDQEITNFKIDHTYKVQNGKVKQGPQAVVADQLIKNLSFFTLFSAKYRVLKNLQTQIDSTVEDVDDSHNNAVLDKMLLIAFTPRQNKQLIENINSGQAQATDLNALKTKTTTSGTKLLSQFFQAKSSPQKLREKLSQKNTSHEDVVQQLINNYNKPSQ